MMTAETKARHVIAGLDPAIHPSKKMDTRVVMVGRRRFAPFARV
jgi:hypothetical protein